MLSWHFFPLFIMSEKMDSPFAFIPMDAMNGNVGILRWINLAKGMIFYVMQEKNNEMFGGLRKRQ